MITTKGRVYADFAAYNGEMAIHNIKQAVGRATVWPEWNVGSAIQHAFEAWHFASCLTPEDVRAVLAHEVDRINWTPARLPGGVAEEVQF